MRRSSGGGGEAIIALQIVPRSVHQRHGARKSHAYQGVHECGARFPLFSPTSEAKNRPTWSARNRPSWNQPDVVGAKRRARRRIFQPRFPHAGEYRAHTARARARPTGARVCAEERVGHGGHSGGEP